MPEHNHACINKMTLDWLFLACFEAKLLITIEAQGQQGGEGQDTAGQGKKGRGREGQGGAGQGRAGKMQQRQKSGRQNLKLAKPKRKTSIDSIRTHGAYESSFNIRCQ